MIRTGDHESDYERLMHGARTSLQAAKSTLKQLEQHDVVLPPQIDTPNLIPNAIDWLEDLENQMNREEFVKAGELDIKSTALYGDVLAKLRPMVARMRTRARNPTFAITGLDELAVTYRQLPRVLADARALDCVFRNLIDNSMKYSKTDPSKSALVEVSTIAAENGESVRILIKDNGIGIPEDEAELIFDNGFRGKRASGRQPQGVGRGLFECRMLLELMDGDISLDSGEDGAVFSVTLKTARGRKRDDLSS
jgi:signal transduction histidine kinase